jgi:hypothetical protein
MFPHPCTHCGLCCIAIVCPVGQELMRVSKQGPCPALEWSPDNPDESRCGLLTRPEHYVPPAVLPAVKRAPMPLIMGSGIGCCISARIIGPKGPQDFAALPPETKTAHVRAIRANTIPLLTPPPP